MGFRGFNIAPPGSLLKGQTKGKKLDMGRSPRKHDGGHLAFIRTLPCLSCGKEPAGEAAHVRMTSAAHGKPNAGVGNKPDDKWTVPLCHWCHVEGPQGQHRVGEKPFWSRLGMNPLPICEELHEATGDRERAGNVIIHAKGGAYPPEDMP